MTMVVRSLHQPVERVLHQPLAFGIERRGRFVEQQQRRIAQQRAGDRDALALSARKPRAAFAHEGVEPFRQRAQELLGIGVARRLPNLVLARVPIAVAEIVARTRGEDHRVLRHHRDALADVGGVGVAKVDAVEQDAARSADRRSARRAGRWSSCRRPRGRPRRAVRGLDVKAEVLERRNLAPRRIMEGDMLECELAARADGAAARFGGRADIGFGMQQLVESFGRAGGAQQVAIDFGSAPNAPATSPP